MRGLRQSDSVSGVVGLRHDQLATHGWAPESGRAGWRRVGRTSDTAPLPFLRISHTVDTGEQNNIRAVHSPERLLDSAQRLAQRDSQSGIGSIRLGATPDLRALDFTQPERCGLALGLCGDAIPEVLDQLNARSSMLGRTRSERRIASMMKAHREFEA